MIQIKGEQGETILIEVTERKYPNAANEWDRDFLKASVRATVNGFSAYFDFLTRRTEIVYLIKQLQELSSSKIKELNFNTIEDHLLLNLHINDLGKIIWKVELQYPEVNRAKLIIHLENGVSSIDLMIKEFEDTLMLL